MRKSTVNQLGVIALVIFVSCVLGYGLTMDGEPQATATATVVEGPNMNASYRKK